LVLYGCVAVVLIYLLVPTFIVIPMSFSPRNFLEFPPSGFSLRWYEAYLSDSAWMGPTLFSLWIAGWTALVSTVVGTLASLALVRGSLPVRDIIITIAITPMVAPIIVVAIGVYSLFLRVGLNGTNLGFVLAHSVLATPYVILTVSAALQRFDWNLELAALSLGASRPTTFLRATLPSILPGVVAGALFAFLASFDEAVVSFFISDIDQTTLPKRLFENIDFGLTPIIAAVSTVITMISLLLLGALELARWRASYRAKAGRASEG
jgi:mannopine transport system permease protein